MSKVTSRGSLPAPAEEISELQRHLEELEQESKTFLEEFKVVSARNKETITSLQIEKSHLRSKLKSVIKGSQIDSQRTREESEEVIKLKRKHDQLRNLCESKRAQLKNMQESLNEAPGETADVMPINRQIRVLESRLEKEMIKYNEAQNIKKTYEQIVKQLKQEKNAFDQQLAAIEKLLRGPENSTEKLLVLNNAEETPNTLLHPANTLSSAEQKDEKNLKTAEPGQSLTVPPRSPTHLNKLNSRSSLKPSRKNREEKIKTKDYEEALKRIKEATGINDENEIIQKFGTQQDTYENLESSKSEHQKTIENLSQIKSELEKQVEILRFKSGQETEKKPLKKSEETLNKTLKKIDEFKVKINEINKAVQKTTTGLNHIFKKIAGFEVEGFRSTGSEGSLIKDLNNCREKIKKMYFLIKKNESFNLLKSSSPGFSRPSDTHRTADLNAIYAVSDTTSYSKYFKPENRGNFTEELSGQDSIKEINTGMRVRRGSSAKKKRFY